MEVAGWVQKKPRIQNGGYMLSVGKDVEKGWGLGLGRSSCSTAFGSQFLTTPSVPPCNVLTILPAPPYRVLGL